jgi:hypothetical protein
LLNAARERLHVAVVITESPRSAAAFKETSEGKSVRATASASAPIKRGAKKTVSSVRRGQHRFGVIAFLQ